MMELDLHLLALAASQGRQSRRDSRQCTQITMPLEGRKTRALCRCRQFSKGLAASPRPSLIASSRLQAVYGIGADNGLMLSRISIRSLSSKLLSASCCSARSSHPVP